MRILAGGPSADPESPHARASLEQIGGQVLPRGVSVEPLHLQDPDARVGYSDQSEHHEGHHWEVRAMRRVGWLRQRYVELARQRGCDAVWLVDDDILCGPTTLMRLLMEPAPIVYGVMWTRDIIDGSTELPQCWDVAQPSVASEEALQAWRAGRTIDVVGGGACTLLHREAWDTYRWWPAVPGLPHDALWQGEDRAACLRATCAIPPLRQLACGSVDLIHLYRPEDRAPEAVQAAVDRITRGAR